MPDAELVEADAYTRAIAFLDANILHPMVLCDLLIRLAQERMYRAVWSRRVLDEVMRSVLRRRPEIPPELLQRRLDRMNEAVPDAQVDGYEHLLPATAVFGDDDHVVAAAMHARADVIVTENLRDFPAEELALRNVYAQRADDFLQSLWTADPRAIRLVLTEQAAGTRNPPFSVLDILRHLEPIAPAFVAMVRRVTPDPQIDDSATIGKK